MTTEANETTAATEQADTSQTSETAAETEVTEETGQETTEETAKPEGAPEQYADFKMPEGTQIDKEFFELAAPVLKDLNLTQESAQKLADLYVQGIQKVAQQQQQHWKDTVDGWVDAAKSDKELGGAKFQANVDVANKAIREFGDENLINMLAETGIGNHPEMIRFAYRIGKAMSEDKMVMPDGAAKESDPAKIMYPNMK